MKTRLLLLLSIFFLASCSGFLVPESSDPHTKLSQSRQLMAQGRHIPAEKLIHEAIDMFKAKQDFNGLAYGHEALAKFYLNKANWNNTPREEYVTKAIRQFDASVDAFAKADEMRMAAVASINKAEIQRVEGQRANACKSFRSAKHYISHGTGRMAEDAEEKFLRIISEGINKTC